MKEYPKYKKVLFCTDFSETSDNAFDYAYGVAKRDEGELFILHVKSNAGGGRFVENLIDKETLETAHKEYMKHVEDEHREHYLNRVPGGTKCTVVSRSGREDEEILKFARKRGVDLIVTGRNGKTALGRLLVGSVSEKVLRHSTVPVFAIPHKEEARVH